MTALYTAPRRRGLVSDLSPPTCVLIVADPVRIAGLADALAEPLPQGPVSVLRSAGGDDTVDLFEARRPHVVVVTATLETGDSKALVAALRGMTPPAVAFVVVGDESGPYRTLLDVTDLQPDKFVTGPVAASALRYAVAGAIDAVVRVRSGRAPTPPADAADAETGETRAEQRARWEALADSFAGDAEEPDDAGTADEPAPLPPPMVRDVAPAQAWKPGTTAALEAPAREPTLIIADPAPSAPPAEATNLPTNPASEGDDDEERIGDSFDDALPLADLLSAPTIQRGTRSPASDGDLDAVRADLDVLRDDIGAFFGVDDYSGPVSTQASRDDLDDLGDLDDLDGLDDLDDRPAPPLDERPDVDDVPLGELASSARAAVSAAIAAVELPVDPDVIAPPAPEVPSVPDGRDFARQLRAKMSMMAQRLFQGADTAEPPPAVDLRPRHDHHTEIDLSTLGDDVSLDRGATEIEAQVAVKATDPQHTTSPGSWDTQIRERGLPDSGELVRGLSDAAMLLAKMFAQVSTGRITFRHGKVEKVVYFDQGRPVFAASSEPLDRMGELLVREGKITAAQYERCQTVVAESGRRMGEILVDFGYLKRRELLPAVRRHVEDIVYSLFGWDRGTYHVAIDATPSKERIRLSRHPAALILEGIRRKLDRSSLERLIGAPSTVIEVPDRERLGGIINLGDLAVEERAALAAFDGQADLVAVARTAGVDVADVLPIAWGLCVLGLASARRTDTEVPDETSALVGETDLAIDRERVRARWELVAEADYFALLGVRRDATAFEIRRAYQSARRDFAADGFPTDLRRELAQELDDIAHVLDEAFRVLRDDRLRLTYLTNLVE